MSSNPDVNPVSLIPSAHLPAATAAAAQGGNTELLKTLQAQLNYLMGNTSTVDLSDIVVVNPTGRIVEITGEMATEYLARPGFRKATPEEEESYRKAMIRQMPEYLRRQEKKRLQAEASMLDYLDDEDTEITPTVAKKDPLQTVVTDAQKTGALTPEQVAQLPDNTVTEAPTATATSTDTPVPPSRKAKPATK